MAIDDILNQDEIDLLLGGGKTAGGQKIKIADPTEPQRYDFSNQERIIRGRMPTLDIINERFGRSLRSSLLAFLRRNVEVTIENIKIQKYAEYIRSLYVPTGLNMVKIRPMRGVGMVLLDAKLVFIMVENFFGGEGKYYTRIEGRDFTPTEKRIIEIVLSKTFINLKEAWSVVMDIDCECVGFEVNPAMANIVSPSEVVVISRFKIELEGGGGELQIALPYSMIEPLREVLDSGVQTDRNENDERWSNILREEILDAPVKIACVLGKKKIKLDKVKNFKKGDVFMMDIPDLAKLYVQGIPLFLGKIGTHEGKLAIEIKDKFDKEKHL